MDIISIQPYKGRNIHSHKPVIKAVVDLGNLYDIPTKQIEGFNERLLKIMPGLKTHVCSLGYEGGFADRLREGTYLAHVTEHMTLELQGLMGHDVNYGKSRATDDPAIYYLVFEFRNEKFAIECLLAAVEIINLLVSGEMPDIDAICGYLRRMAAESDLGTSTGAIYREAIRRNIPVTCLEHSSVLQLGNGKYTRYLEASLSDRSGCVAVDIAGNKHLTKQMLSGAGIPVPRGDIAYTLRSAAVAAAAIGWPVVVKPFDANQGKGVFTNITDMKELENAFETASGYSHAVLVERHIPGKDYRLLAAGGKMIAAAERRAPFVIGDGINTIRQLVEIENLNPLRGADHEKPLTIIKIDDMSRQVLAKCGYSENSIPAPGEKVVLRYNGNLSTGGTARDCTDEVHPYNAELAVKAAQLMELDIAGIDITCKDISKPLDEENGAVIEVNAAPGLRMHIYPTEGMSRNVAGDILDYLYPQGEPSGIPIVSITGTNGKTTVARMIAHVLSLDGTVVGMTSTSGIYIGGECILKGDNTGVLSAARVLKDTRVEAAVLETARGGIIRRGLGYDLADVGVIINISDDHLGIDGVNTLEDLAKVKSLVAEAVKPNGTAVLNADDKMTPMIMKRINCKPMLFASKYDNLLLQRAIKEGNKAVYVKDGAVYVSTGGNEIFIAHIADIPITFGGKAACNVENTLAAVSSLYALDIPPAKIREGISGFRPDTSTNPGRFNIFEMDGFSVMLDYGHNIAGYGAAIEMMQGLNASMYTGIIGMPGDRRDESINEVGRLCGRSFSKIYIKEDRDPRGRDVGKVADLLYNAVISEGINKKMTRVIYQETKALETAIMEAIPGEMIIMFYEEFEPAVEVIERCRKALEQRSIEKKPPVEDRASSRISNSASGW
ncbi:MAG: cyanophycin synthetase [Clostridiaceae bacterium]|nr:cyanophycin synthetase [Clostridiaceae bacterium]